MPDAPSDFASRRPAQAAADASPPTDVAAQLGANQVGKNQGGAEPANPAEPPAAGGFRDLVDRLGRVANLIVIDVGQQGGSENLAITGLRTSEPFVTTGDDVSLEGQVRNFGTQPQNHRLVECYVDGRRVRETYVDVPAGEQAPVAFRHRFDTAANHGVEFRLASDLLDVDNHRWLSQTVKDYLRVLCVNGKPATGGMSGATDYLARALNPEEDAAHHGVVRPEVIPESALVERDLSAYDCIFLCNIGQFTASEARLLDAYTRAGGGLVIFLGDQTMPDRYNRLLGPGAETPLLGAKLGAKVDESQYRFDPLEYKHPLVAAFQGREQAGLLTTPIYQYYRLTVPEHSSARVALGFEGGDPAVVEQAVGRGRVILVATDGSLSSIDPATHMPWTAWAAWPSYLPLVQEMLAEAVAGQQSQRNLLVGQTISESAPASLRGPLTLIAPDGRREELRVATDAEGGRWTAADASTSGPYTLEAGSTRPEIFAVNVDTAESNLARIDPSDLPRGFTMNHAAALEESEENVAGERGSLSKMLLYAALALVFCETFLAWRFGNRNS